MCAFQCQWADYVTSCCLCNVLKYTLITFIGAHQAACAGPGHQGSLTSCSVSASQHYKMEFKKTFHKPSKFVIRLEELYHVKQFNKHRFGRAEVTIIISIIEMTLLEMQSCRSPSILI